MNENFFQDIINAVKLAFNVDLHINKNNLKDFEWEKTLDDICEKEAIKALLDTAMLRKLADIPNSPIWDDIPFSANSLTPRDMLSANICQVVKKSIMDSMREIYERKLAKATR